MLVASGDLTEGEIPLDGGGNGFLEPFTISELTVKSHIGRIFTKLHLRDRAAVAQVGTADVGDVLVDDAWVADLDVPLGTKKYLLTDQAVRRAKFGEELKGGAAVAA